MKLSKIFFYFASAALLASCSLWGAENEPLQLKDVNKIMQQIFDQHVDKKEISDSILKKSFKVYIDQFDPKRIYLKDEEIAPFLNLTNAQIANIMAQYKNHEFSEYHDLNTVIQTAIQTARKYRAEIEKIPFQQLFQDSSKLSVTQYEEWRDPDLTREFAKSDTQLKANIRNEIVQFLASERKRYGDAVVLNHPQQTLQMLEKKLREHENQYLFVQDNGHPMSEIEQQNTYAMHILKSLANSLDSHTTILNASEAYDMRFRLEKQVDGVGVVLQPTDNGFIVAKLIEGGPAALSGQIKLGDKIEEIDGKSTKNMLLDQIRSLLQGKKGSTVSLILTRTTQNGEPQETSINVQLTRQPIAVDEDRVQTSYEPYGNGIIGKIKLDTFYQSDNGITSENDMRRAIQKLDKQGNLRALILDFRENSGGFLSQAVKVAGLFITNGVVVVSKYFNGEEKFYRDMDGKIAYDGPLIILTSKATASAAEIVAQALQDYGVAIIVGDVHTYGKGTIQSQTVTENQGSTYFKVTVGKYYTVSGKTPQIQGVKADVVVPSQFVHENIGEEYLEYPLQQDLIAPSYNDPLTDVPSNLKSWYLKYYVSTVQHKNNTWREMLPSLKKNSEVRIAKNQDYQSFLQNTSAITKSKRPSGDLQLSEATNIAKDMVNLYTQQRGKPLQHTAAIPNANNGGQE